MEYLIAVGYIVGWLLVVVCCRFITTTFHELGHAIPALLYTDGNVKIHVGSYGDDRSKNLQFGRLTAYFKFNPLHLNFGLCQHEKPATFNHIIRIILGGPLFSLLLGLLLILLIKLFQLPDAGMLVLMAFIISSIWDFFINLIPFSQPIRMYDGSMTYNDGQQLMTAIQLRKYPPEFHKGQTYFQEGDYQNAIVNFRKTIDAGHADKGVYFCLVQSLLNQRNYKSALHCCEEIDQRFKLEPNDFDLFSTVFLVNKNYTKTIECLDKTIYYNFNNAIAYNKRGYAYLMLENYKRAESDLRMAIRQDSKFGFPYNNLALVYLRKGELEKVLPLIERSRELQPDNPFLSLHLGYYYEALKEYNTALEHFKNAKEQGIDFDRIEVLIDQMKEKLSENSV